MRTPIPWLRDFVEGVVIVGFALAPNFAQAQEWSAEELDLFEQVEHYQEGYGARTWEEQVRECGLDASLQYWMAGEAEPRGIDWMREAVENVWPEIEVMSQDFEPVRVTREGETFFLFLRGSRTIRERDGDVVLFAWIGMEIWRRESSGWTTSGAQVRRLPPPRALMPRSR